MHKKSSKFKIFSFPKNNKIGELLTEYINTARVSFFIKFAVTILFVISLMLLTPIFFSRNISAQNSSALNYYFEVRINENGSASGKTIITLQNTESQNFITGYKFSLPIKNISSVQAFADGEELWLTTSDIGQYKSIDINLRNHEIRGGESKSIEINWNSSSLVEVIGTFKQVYIPKPIEGQTLQNVTYKIFYPKSYGREIHVDLSSVNLNESGNSYQFEVNISDGLFLHWGDKHKFGIEAKFKILNDSEIRKQTLFSIPNDIKQQTVDYVEIIGTEYGLKDKLNNYYGYSELAPKTEKEISIKANVEIGQQVHKEFENIPVYGFQFNKDSTNIVKWNSELEKQDSSYNKVKKLNELIVKNSKVSSNEKVDPNVMNTIWTRFDTNSGLSSFELCFIIISYAETQNLQARMNFGYIVYPFNTVLKNSNPHFWCEINIDNKWILADPYLESVLGVVYFDRIASDRIYLGTWHPSINYTNALGLIGEGDSVLLSINAEHQLTKEEQSLLSIELPTNVISGNFFSGTLRHYNLGRKILTPKSLYIDGWNYSDQLFVNENLQIAFLPQTSNIKEINYIRESSFFYDGKKNLTSEIAFTDETKIITSNEMTFEPNKIFFIFLLSATLALLFVCIGILFKIIFAKRKRIILV